MTTDVVYFLPPFIGFVLIALAFSYKEPIAGFLGGMTLFLFGVAIIISPIESIPAFLNYIVGVITFGYGAYVMLADNVDRIKEMLG